MNWNPFRRNRETRSGADTASIVAAIQAAAAGSLDAIPGTTSAAEMAAGLISRAFLSARVLGAPASLAESLTPRVVAHIARSLAKYGESLHMIDVSNGRILLHSGAYRTWTGNYSPDTWRCELSLEGPSGNYTVKLPYAQILHVRYAYAPARPWIGIGPMQAASTGNRLAEGLASALANEVTSPLGSFLPLPRTGGTEETVSALRKDLANAKGDMLLVESMADNWQSGNAGARPADWTQKRFGANPPAPLIQLHEIATREVLGAYGLSPALFSAGEGTSGREAWRQALFGVITPYARLIEDEIRLKLDAPEIMFDFTELRASDLQARARSFKALVESGMELAKATAVSGLMIGE